MIDTVVVGNGLNALGVLRSLKLSSGVLHVLSDKNFIGVYSRYAKYHIVQSTQDETIVKDLLDLPYLADKVMLILTEEKTVEQVSKSWGRLRHIYCNEMPSYELVKALQDKVEFYKLASNVGSPVPKTVEINRTIDVDQALSELTFPCALKPAFQDANYAKQFKKAYRVASNDEAKALIMDMLHVCPFLVIQEWIEGADSGIYFTFSYFSEKGDIISSFCGRKLFSWPPYTGGTAACVRDIKNENELLKLSHEFMRMTSCTGLLGMEYKWDEVREKFYMIEPTVARTDYQHEIAALSNVNFLGKIRAHLLKLKNTAGSDVPKNNVVWYDPYSMYNLRQLNGERLPDGLSKRSNVHRLSDPGPSIKVFLNKFMQKTKG